MPTQSEKVVVQGVYLTNNCDCVQCGSRCLEQFEVDLFLECNGQCQSVDIPCNGTCPVNSVPCGDICLSGEMINTFLECNGKEKIKFYISYKKLVS